MKNVTELNTVKKSKPSLLERLIDARMEYAKRAVETARYL